jgi:iron complex transport system ATP-binding protein
MGVGARVDHPFGTLSSGERQRTLLARAQMCEPGLLIVDEPNAGLDLGGREELLAQFDRLAAAPAAPPMLLVTHHVEEIPTRFTHLLALDAGRVLARGPIDDTLDADLLSTCFGVDLEVGRVRGRWWARARA